MDRRGAVDDHLGGGGLIAATRSRPRLAYGAGALLFAIGVAAFATLEADRLTLVIGAFGALSLALLVSALAKVRPETMVTALLGLGACWTASAWTQAADAPGGTILVAAGVFVTAELAFASLEQVAVPDEPELMSRRLAGIAARGLGALVLAAILLAALGLDAGGGLVLEAVGVVAAIGLLLLVLVLARAEREPAER